jgi:hypothetical protein
MALKTRKRLHRYEIVTTRGFNIVNPTNDLKVALQSS